MGVRGANGLPTRKLSQDTLMAILKLHIRDPWTMPYLRTVDTPIDALHMQIGPEHVLYRREVVPLALRRDPDAIIYETDDDPCLGFPVVESSRN